jgi:hypothetical protein
MSCPGARENTHYLFKDRDFFLKIQKMPPQMGESKNELNVLILLLKHLCHFWFHVDPSSHPAMEQNDAVYTILHSYRFQHKGINLIRKCAVRSTQLEQNNNTPEVGNPHLVF